MIRKKKKWLKKCDCVKGCILFLKTKITNRDELVVGSIIVPDFNYYQSCV